MIDVEVCNFFGRSAEDAIAERCGEIVFLMIGFSSRVPSLNPRPALDFKYDTLFDPAKIGAKLARRGKDIFGNGLGDLQGLARHADRNGVVVFHCHSGVMNTFCVMRASICVFLDNAGWAVWMVAPCQP